MITQKIFFLSAIVILLFPGCAKSPLPDADRANSGSSLQATDDYPVIAHFEFRDKTVTYKSGPDDVIYLVKSADGTIIADHLSTDQMQAQHPDLLFEMKHMMADLPTAPPRDVLHVPDND